MTHTLHREGDVANLSADFVILSMSAKTINDAGSADRLKRLFAILRRHDPVNVGDMITGNVFNAGEQQVADSIRDTSIIHAVFTDPEAVRAVLDELRDAELGPSVVVTGIVEVVGRLCREAGLRSHTVEVSGGVHGRRDLLPGWEVLQITTMCGHGMVPGSLVRHLLDRVKSGETTIEEVARDLARPCQCGIFNPRRAAVLMKRMAGQE